MTDETITRKLRESSRRQLAEPVLCMGQWVRSCRQLGCYSATLGPFCIGHADAIERT